MSCLISSYLTNKGLEVIWSLVKDEIYPTVSVDSLSMQLDSISKRLDMLIDAPYKAAYLYYKEGNIEKFKEKIIDAISLDDFNLPAQVAYINILISENKMELAIEQYWNILDKYGHIKELVPTRLIELHKQLNHSNIQIGFSQLNIIPGDGDCIFKRYGYQEISTLLNGINQSIIGVYSQNIIMIET